MADSLTFAPLASRALIAVRGPGWRDFLQNLLTQDVESLRPGEARFGALLTPQGRLLHDLFIVGREDGCWLDVEAAQRQALIQRLMIYRLRAKVEIAADPTDVAAVFPRAGGNPSGGSIAAGSAWAPVFAGVSGTWLADPRLPELGWRGYAAAAPAGATIGSEADYEAHRLAAGAPGPGDWGVERTYPIEADFDLLNGIDFQKGCFVGQETTSRMKRRGQVKNRMLPIAFEGRPPAFGTEVMAGERRAGEVLTGREGRAMALLRLDRIEGAALSVDGRSVKVERPPWLHPREA
ncbi:folate-binding protein YgfZ [Phenylobacterium sp.]|uniref:CAF17-like 4Fe-4S cluster assembly/insertion protein YgfZ n=1 Tax=Phenylobacterium sp. TaxID=1871053 RepID=UPI0026153FC1|nr:folate-binding protein YgfZ [Phenylobacterium sp.]